jgi:hypothetical protein
VLIARLKLILGRPRIFFNTTSAETLVHLATCTVVASQNVVTGY